VTASFADNEIWHVLIASDDMKRMNVDQLDDAFRLSLVDASTMVWKAGMNTWQRLGAVAGLEDEPPVALVTRRAPPAPPRPIARPAPHPPSRAPAPFQTAVTPVFQTQMLVAPVFTSTLQAPDPYVLPKRRVAIPSEVDFRRASGGLRVRRWAFGLLLLTGAVLGAYRQNLLREGARRLGVETKYLAGEHRATAFVTAKAPAALKNVLTRLALLPGPNAVAAEARTASAEPQPAALAPAALATSVVAAAKPSTATNSEPEVKTVSLDSLPVLAADPSRVKAPAAAAALAAPAVKARPAVAAHRPEPKPARESARATAKVEKPEPVEKAEPKPKAAPPPPAANDSPLKAAIRMAIAADNAKKK